MARHTVNNMERGNFTKTIGWLFGHLEWVLIVCLVLVATLQYNVRPQSQSLLEIKKNGYIKVLISDEPDSQYLFNQRHYGFEYELLNKFAEQLGVELKLQVVPFAELFSLLNHGAGDIAVGGILDNPYVRRIGQPTLVWHQAETAVVYRRGTKRPKNLQQLGDEQVLASARYYQIQGFEKLNLADDYRSEYELLNAVANGTERFALSTNYRARKAKHYLPELNRSFIMPNKVDLVWVLPKRHDADLLAVLNQFLRESKAANLTEQLANDYLALPQRLSTYDALAIHEKINTILPNFEYAFRKAARKGDIDWYMLAAMAYQESKWSNSAKSPTGVRGIMQLTESTAEFLDVDDRMDMTQSIDAAAIYVRQLRARLPKSIKEPERTWFAVGAYNIGFKHIMNAYRKAKTMGLDATQWQVISELLPTLYDESYGKGKQAKSYVERVQIFTDILRFYDSHQRKQPSFDSVLAVDGLNLDYALGIVRREKRSMTRARLWERSIVILW